MSNTTGSNSADLQQAERLLQSKFRSYAPTKGALPMLLVASITLALSTALTGIAIGIGTNMTTALGCLAMPTTPQCIASTSAEPTSTSPPGP